MVNIEILQYIWNRAPGERYIPFMSYFHYNEIFRAPEWSGIWVVELARLWKEHGQAPSRRKEKLGKQLRHGELPSLTGPETESTVYHQVQICASMKSSNGKRERSLPQNQGFHPYFFLRSEKLRIFKTWEDTGEKPPHLPGRVLITTGVYWYGYLFPAHCRDPWVKEGTFSRCICSPLWARQGSQIFLLCFLPKSGRQAQGPSFQKVLCIHS